MKTNTEEIQTIKDSGYRLVVTHRRPYDIESNVFITKREAESIGITHENVLSRAGLTEATAYLGNTRIATARARCADADNFSYRIGTAIALGRLEKYLILK